MKVVIMETPADLSQSSIEYAISLLEGRAPLLLVCSREALSLPLQEWLRDKHIAIVFVPKEILKTKFCWSLESISTSVISVMV